MLDLGLDLNLWPWIWLAVGVGLTVAEFTVLGRGLRALPFGVAAFLTSILAFGDVAIELQWATFAGGGALLLGIFWRYQSLIREGNRLPPGAGAVRLVGMEGVVVRAHDPAVPDRGVEVFVLGETWVVINPPELIHLGATVVVTEVEGTRVRVEPTTRQTPVLTEVVTDPVSTEGSSS